MPTLGTKKKVWGVILGTLLFGSGIWLIDSYLWRVSEAYVPAGSVMDNDLVKIYEKREHGALHLDDVGETKYVPQAVVTQFDTLILSIGGGELWLRLPSGEWIRYREKSHELLPESAPE